eukprot:CAMPEP_0116146522 /NCGR_PEP_ID=MMETSP0329-20121206/17209_1 /TAXON_ID=697910 /ORGANISM="Pseudo-nitzschia arenysensis, Strain B593" /LENGTH=267 /DNA_ID=CAMNT_0003642275 /DNA_START=12 /DNA_END=812 /DNA_ORIENTATION=-
MSSDCVDVYDLYENPSIEIDENGAALTPTKLDRDDASLEGDDAYMSDSTASLSDTERENGRKKSLRKLKKLGKKTAKGTTKLAAKGLRGTGIATGKLIAPVSRKSGKQPKREPKKKFGAKESQARSAAKKMKKLGRIEAKSGEPPMFVAGALSATEQSRRTASRILERMSSVSMQSSAWQKYNNALSSELGFVTDQDTWFLDGDAVHLGVKPRLCISELNPAKNTENFSTKAWSPDVCGNLIGEKNGAVCTKILSPFMFHWPSRHVT